MNNPRYTHQTYGVARLIVQDDDGTVRELPPDHPYVREWSRRMTGALARSIMEVPDGADKAS